MKSPLLKKLEGYSREQNQLLKTMDLQAKKVMALRKKKDSPAFAASMNGLAASLKTSAKLRVAMDKAMTQI
jgi:hypothetical protein